MPIILRHLHTPQRTGTSFDLVHQNVSHSPFCSSTVQSISELEVVFRVPFEVRGIRGKDAKIGGGENYIQLIVLDFFSASCIVDSSVSVADSLLDVVFQRPNLFLPILSSPLVERRSRFTSANISNSCTAPETMFSFHCLTSTTTVTG